MKNIELNLNALKSEVANELKKLNSYHCNIFEKWKEEEHGNFDEVHQKTLDEAQKIASGVAVELEKDNPNFIFIPAPFGENQQIETFFGKIEENSQIDGEWMAYSKTWGKQGKSFEIGLDGADEDFYFYLSCLEDIEND